MSEQPPFKAEVFQNEYLPTDSTVVDAVVTVTASGEGASAGSTPTTAQVIMIDCSGSMAQPATKMSEAKRATAAAIDSLPDGVAFAVVAGRNSALMAYPNDQELVVASKKTRAAAKEAVTGLTASGGTAMGQWLHLARPLFAGRTAGVKHGILLTDGRNQHETAEQLDAILRECEGRFLCDSRGVGADWSGAELRTIASALLGTADGLPDPTELVDDFRSMTERAMGKAYAEVSLRLWTPDRSTIRFVKQALPHVA